ncbi:MAG: MmcQ/YjbR family DNA-binding protein [Brevefilum sp.]|nr:MmcQ/YjbR family DNA-binding protein [Brevefilum sp.]
MDYESLCAYLEGKTAARRDMPFGIDTLVFKVLDRIFALVAWQEEPLTISLKADPIDAVILRKQYAAITAGYHLNKKHWNTVRLVDSVPDDEVRRMIDESYTLVVEKMTKSKQQQLRRMGWQNNGETA